jgi:hypothetical protein
MGIVSIQEHLSLWLAVICCLWTTAPWTFDGNVYASWFPKLPLLATSLSQSCLTLQSWTSSSWSCSQLYECIKHEWKELNSVGMLWASSGHVGCTRNLIVHGYGNTLHSMCIWESWMD